MGAIVVELVTAVYHVDPQVCWEKNSDAVVQITPNDIYEEMNLIYEEMNLKRREKETMMMVSLIQENHYHGEDPSLSPGKVLRVVIAALKMAYHSCRKTS